MKKSQISLFVIIFVLLVVMIAFLAMILSEKNKGVYAGKKLKTYHQETMQADTISIIESCIEYSVKETFQDTGIREENLKEYELKTSKRIVDCVDPFFTQIESQNYNVKKGELNLKTEINPQTVIVEVTYPIKIKKELEEIEFNKYQYSFDRYVEVKIPGGKTNSEIRLISSNGKAEVSLPEGVEIKDKEGNPIEKIGMNVLDRQFDSLENKYVLGELAYENLPDGLTFSEPVEFSIEFREEDIPEGYTKENIKIAYWDEEDGIWYAQPSSIIGNRVITNITHYSIFDMVLGGPHIFVNTVFETRFKPSQASSLKEGEKNRGVWLIGPGDKPDVGTVTLQPGFYQNSYIDWTDEGTVTTSFENGYDGFDAMKDIYTKPDNNLFNDYKNPSSNQPSDYIKPKLQYGYYLDQDTSNLDGFVDCEIPENGAQNPYNMNYELGDDELPYYFVSRPHIRSDLYCTCNENDNICENFCYNKKTGYGISSSKSETKICLPIGGAEEVDDEDLQKKTVLCEVVTNPSNDDYDQSKVFGWHNFQCVGGRVTPSEEFPEASEFLVFEPKGNAVILPGIDMVTTYPSKSEMNLVDIFWHIADLGNVFKTVLKFAKGESSNMDVIRRYGEYISSFFDDADEFSFYCEIIPYGTENYQLLETSISGPTYGVYGVNVVKRLDHESSKTNLKTKCELYWTFWGNGFLKTNSQSNNFLDEIKERIS